MHKKRVTGPTLWVGMIFVLGIALLAPMIARAEGAIEAQWLVNPQAQIEEGDIAVGDPIQLVLEVTHPEGHLVLLPELGSEWGDWTVASQAPATTVTNDDGTATTRQVIDVRAFAPGTYSTPPLDLTVSDSTGQLTEVSVPPASVTLSSVLVEGDTELRDIKPQAELPFTALWPWFAAGALVLAGAAGFYLWKRSRRVRLARVVVDNRPPYQVALDELERVEGLRLPAQGRFKAHYTLVSDCMRTYGEQTWNVPVLERTTGEVWASLRQTDLTPEIVRQFVRLLGESDLVKFAKYTPQVDEARQLVAHARDVVHATRPVAAPQSDELGEHAEDAANVASQRSWGAGRGNGHARKHSEVTV